MAKDSRLFQFINTMPPWGKAVVVIGGLGIVTVSGITIYKLIKEANEKKKNQSKSDQIVSASQSGLDALATKGVYPSYMKEQYVSWADALDACFQGYGTCSNYMNVFEQMKNDADVFRLIQEYGVRTISSGKWNLAPDFTGDLTGAMRDELSSAELSDVNDVFSKKGIVFKF